MSDWSEYPETRNSRNAKLAARCPECQARVELKDTVELWDLLTCPECETRLEVVDLHPPELDYPDEDFLEEDWEDWEDEEEPGDTF